MAQTRWRIF